MGGRPTKYRSEYCQQLINFFSVEPTTEVKKTMTTAKGTIIEEPVQRANKLPTFERFAANLGVHVDTLIEWTRVHRAFSEAYARAKALQKDILNTNALLGLYDSHYAKFVAVNCTDMRDRQEIGVEPLQTLTDDELEAKMLQSFRFMITGLRRGDLPEELRAEIVNALGIKDKKTIEISATVEQHPVEDEAKL